MTLDLPAGSRRSFSPIFELLAGRPHNGGELIGLIAYALYKREKREWATALSARLKRAPTEAELAEYVATCTPSRLASYRAEAGAVLGAYTSVVIAREETRILRDALRGSFWPSVVRSAFGAALYSLALIALSIVLVRAGVDVIGILAATAE